MKQVSNFAEVLNKEYQSRRTRNRRYSLRKFAQFLSIDPSFLSKLIAGKRQFTASTVREIGIKLGMSSAEIEIFSTAARPPRKKPNRKKMQLNPLPVEKFQMISEWYHFAILELVTLKDFSPSAAWIAKRLNIDTQKASDAIDRLFRLGFLKEENGRWVSANGNNTTLSHTESAKALRELQKQILTMSVTALESLPIALRDQTSMTMAIAAKDIERAKKMITQFRRKFCISMQEGVIPDSVYQLAISFYPVTPVRGPVQ